MTLGLVAFLVPLLALQASDYSARAEGPPVVPRPTPPIQPGLVPRDRIQLPPPAPTPTAPAPLPDLVVESCKLYCIRNGDSWTSPPECSGGIDPSLYKVEIRGVVRNAGVAGTFVGGVFTDTLRDADPATAPLGANRSLPEMWMSAGYIFSGQGWFEVPIPSDFPLGSHTSVVRVDPRKLVPEANENNNFCSITWNRIGTVAVPTDLDVTAVAVSPASGPPDTPFQFTVTVRNSAGPTPGDFWVGCDRSLTAHKVSGLAPSQSKQLVFPISTPFTPGSRTVTCTVDEAHKVLDRNPSNNKKSVTFTVTPP